MVAIRNDQLFVGHRRGEQANGGRVTDTPDAVQNTVLVGDFGVSRSGILVEDLFHASGRVRIKHENLAKVGLCGLEKV